MEDKINKHVVIIHGNDSSKTQINLNENIRNIVAVKHNRTTATINSNTQSHPSFQNVFIKINDFNLKDVYTSNTSFPCFAHLTFQGSSPTATYITSKSNSTGIITDFDTDSDNYVLNPILPQLNKLTVEFFNENLSPQTMKEFTTELTIYTKFVKETML